MWLADVGQNQWEEVNVVEPGVELRLEHHGGCTLFSTCHQL